MASVLCHSSLWWYSPEILHLLFPLSLEQLKQEASIGMTAVEASHTKVCNYITSHVISFWLPPNIHVLTSLQCTLLFKHEVTYSCSLLALLHNYTVGIFSLHIIVFNNNSNQFQWWLHCWEYLSAVLNTFVQLPSDK